MAQPVTCGRLHVNVDTKNATGLTSKSSSFAGRRVTFAAFRNAQPQSRGTLQVCASKGKGKKLMRRGPGSGQGGGQMLPPTPPVDPDNAEFVIFVRSKKLPKWVPLSIVKGGTAANMLIKSLESDLGNKLYGQTLVRNIGQALYKDKAAVERSIRSQYPPLKDVKEFEYGFKIRDKENPAKWYVADSIKVIPPEEELGGTVLDNVKDFFDTGFKSLSKALKPVGPQA